MRSITGSVFGPFGNVIFQVADADALLNPAGHSFGKSAGARARKRSRTAEHLAKDQRDNRQRHRVPRRGCDLRR